MDIMSIEALEELEEEKEMDPEEFENLSDAHNMKIEFLAQQYLESNMKCNHDDVHHEAKELNEVDEFRANFFMQIWLIFWR